MTEWNDLTVQELTAVLDAELKHDIERIEEPEHHDVARFEGEGGSCEPTFEL